MVLSKKRINEYFSLAWDTAEKGDCLKSNYGAVIVKNGKVISTGYTHTVKNFFPCKMFGYCIRESLGIPSGEGYEYCKSIHAEWDAISKGNIDDLKGSTIFILGIDGKDGKIKKSFPCQICKKLILDAGITEIYCALGYINGVDRYKFVILEPDSIREVFNKKVDLKFEKRREKEEKEKEKKRPIVRVKNDDPDKYFKLKHKLKYNRLIRLGKRKNNTHG